MKLKIKLGGHYKNSPIRGYALIDKQDFDLINKHGWNLEKFGYAVCRINIGYKKSKLIKMHSLIMNSPKGMEVDHINHNKLDNRRENLRIVTRSQNFMNRTKRENTSSIYKGVSWDKQVGKWKATFGKKSLGFFQEERWCAMAYDIFAKDKFKEYAKLNFQPICLN